MAEEPDRTDPGSLFGGRVVHGCKELVYSCSDRRVWILDSTKILRERGTDPPTFEVDNLRFVKRHTTTPVPDVLESWTQGDRYFSISGLIPGETLSTVWADLSDDERDRVAKQTADVLAQLRMLHSPRLESLGGKPLYDAFLFCSDYGAPHGPLGSDDQLQHEMWKALKAVPEGARQRLRARMPRSEPYTFTHGDLAMSNIMVQNGNLSGIIDWERAGFFPAWWEFAAAGIGLGLEDKAWKTLVQSHMTRFDEEREWWLDFWLMSKYPTIDPRAKERGLFTDAD